VPGDDGTARLVELAKSGVKVRILTNSLAACDESVVHAFYMTRRLELLRAGVALWELKPTAMKEPPEVAGRFGSGKAAVLHGKAFAVDRQQIFVGSFNFDQRSARLNTELGLVVDDTAFAQQLADVFDKVVPEVAYEVRLAPDRERLVWIERTAAGEEKRYDHDPETDGLKRLQVQFLAILPIEWLL
jgi:putative cardiolipin synthase